MRARALPRVPSRSCVLAAALACTALPARAGGAASGCQCVPTGHNVSIPGVTITAPSVTVNVPTINYGYASSSSSSNASAFTDTSVNVSVNSASTTNAAAASNVLSTSGYYGGGGGGGGFSLEAGNGGVISNLSVAAPAGETRQVCAVYATAVRAVALQAVCLDDKAVPHPASQVTPDRELSPGYAGEVFRCIAGARMQYTTADYAGTASFDHGQTAVCRKGEALAYDGVHGLQCRPQKPARDCNERSLLRRYGAGIKLMRLQRAGVCTAWRTETVAGGEAMAAEGGALALDGGVGGVAR